jgi:hypothetical protein
MASVNFYRLPGTTTQKTAIFILAAVRTSDLTDTLFVPLSYNNHTPKLSLLDYIVYEEVGHS